MTTRSALYLGMLETIKARSDAASAATVLATRTAMNSLTRPCQMQPIENSFEFMGPRTGSCLLAGVLT